MKHLGHTPSGGAIIELSPAEQSILRNALAAVKGSGIPNSYSSDQFRGLPDDDLSPLFAIMADWADIRFNLNFSRHILDDLQAAIEGKAREQT